MNNEQGVNQETFKFVLQRLAKIGNCILPTVSLNLFNGALEKDILIACYCSPFRRLQGSARTSQQ